MTDSSLDTPSGRGNGVARSSVWLVLLCALMPFAAVRHFDHVWDDHALRGPGSLAVTPTVSWGELAAADLFDVPGTPAERSGFWRPAALLSFRVEALLAGSSEAGFLWLGHVVTLGLHLLATCLLLHLLVALGARASLSLLAAALFGLHPVHAEPVSWISGRMDVGSTAAGFAALLLLARGRGARPLELITAAAWLLLGLLFKESGVLFLALWILLARCLELPWRRALGAPSLAATSYLVLRFSAYGTQAGVTAPDGAWSRWSTALAAVPEQLRLLIWPGPATSLHPLPTRTDLDAAGMIGIALLLILLACALGALRRRQTLATLSFGVLGLGLVMVLPWVGQRPATNSLTGPLNERFLYALALAPCIGLASLAQQTPLRAMRFTRVACLVLLVVLTPVTANRALAWQDDQSFALTALQTAPHKADLWAHLGDARLQSYAATQDPEALRSALSAFEAALQRDPEHLQASVNRFITLQGLGANEEVIERAADLLRRWPQESLVLYNLAVWHAAQGELERAHELLVRDLEKAPWHPLSRSLLTELRSD